MIKFLFCEQNFCFVNINIIVRPRLKSPVEYQLALVLYSERKLLFMLNWIFWILYQLTVLVSGVSTASCSDTTGSCERFVVLNSSSTTFLQYQTKLIPSELSKSGSTDAELFMVPWELRAKSFLNYKWTYSKNSTYYLESTIKFAI